MCLNIPVTTSFVIFKQKLVKFVHSQSQNDITTDIKVKNKELWEASKRRCKSGMIPSADVVK